MISQDDLQFWLLELKQSKSNVLTEYALSRSIENQGKFLHSAIGQTLSEAISPSEVMKAAIRLSVDCIILAEKIKV